MELLALALQQSLGAQGLPFGMHRKSDVDGRSLGLAAQGAQAADQVLADDIGVGGAGLCQKQPPPGDRRKRNRNLKLGIVVPASTMISLSPGVVENIFAHGMALQIGRCGGAQMTLRVFHHNVGGRPSGAPAH